MTNAALLVLSLVASIVMGEVSVAPCAGDLIAQMVVRDMDIGRDLSRWHGRQVPNAWAWECATAALLCRTDVGLPRHALSEHDIVALGFDRRNWRNVGSKRWPVWISSCWE